MDDSWKSEYETHVQSWRAESAEAREKAERERAKWEEIRAKEKQQQAQSEPPKAQAVASNVGAEPSPADARDLVTGEKEVRDLLAFFALPQTDRLISFREPCTRTRTQVTTAKPPLRNGPTFLRT